MTSKTSKSLKIKSYDQILKFKIRKFKSDFPLGKRLENVIYGKGSSAPQKRSEVFQNKSIEKVR